MKIRIAARPDPDHPLRLSPTEVEVAGVSLASVCREYTLHHRAGDIPTLDFTLNVLGIDLGCEQEGRLGTVSIAGLGPVRTILLEDGRVLAGAGEVFAALSEYHRRAAYDPDCRLEAGALGGSGTELPAPETDPARRAELGSPPP